MINLSERGEWEEIGGDREGTGLLSKRGNDFAYRLPGQNQLTR